MNEIIKKKAKALGARMFRGRFLLGAFFLTYLALTVFAVIAKLAPFGDRSLLSMDLHGQYYPMMAEKLSDPFSVWSWHGSLGFSSLVQGSYYTNSIFLFLLTPFSGYARVSAMHFMFFLKLALASAFFAYYLDRKHGKQSVFTMVFGVAYGLSAYMTSYIAQPMWIDIVVFLPLILLALEKMMEGGSPLAYTLLLALAIFSNFYISFALCIFLVLWFFVYLISEKRRTLKELARCTGNFALYSAIGGALCASMLLPLVKGMENWISSSLSFSGEMKWYHKTEAIADAFAFGVKPSWEYGVANVFCGSAVIFFALLFLFNCEIPLKKRIAQGALAVILFVSFEWNLLDFIWHGFHFPNQLPARQSFLFIFVILLMAYEAILHKKGIRFVSLFVSLIVSVSFFFMGREKTVNASGRFQSVIMILAVCLVIAVMFFLQKARFGKKICSTLLAVLLLSDSIGGGVYVLCKYARTTDGRSYVAPEAELAMLAEKYESGRDAFWRSEVTPNFTFNPGQLYGINGISYYSSTMNGNLYRLFEKLGNRVYAKNVSSVYQPTPIQDMMFGVRYHYMRAGWWIDYAERIDKTEKISVYESPYALPIAYAANNKIKKLMDNPERHNGIDFQGKFLALASGISVPAIMRAGESAPKAQNATLTATHMNVKDIESEMTYSIDFFAKEDGYFYFDFDFTVGNFVAYVNGARKRTGSCNANPIFCMGYVNKGDTISVEVTVKGYRSVLQGISGWTMNKDRLTLAHEKLAAGGLQITSTSDTRMKGTISVAEDGVLYSSIPAENGWSVYVDGEKQETYDLGIGLLACDITQGEHTVEYRYSAPGLTVGLLVSLSALGVLIFLTWIRKKRKITEIADD